MVERMVGSTYTVSNVHEIVDENNNPYRNMDMNAMRIKQGHTGQYPIVDEERNADVTRFFDLLKDFDEPLWDGCINHSKLSVIAQIFTIKSDHGLSEANYENIIK